MQKSELQLTRDEYIETRGEYTKTTNVIYKQSIENTFFSLINLHNKITDGLSFKIDVIHEINNNILKDGVGRKSIIEGRYVFSIVYQCITENIALHDESGRHIQETGDQIVMRRYKNIQDNYNDVLGHYFRNLYQIIKFIDDLST